MKESGISEASMLVNAMHITASGLINGDAHLKRQIMGREIVVCHYQGEA